MGLKQISVNQTVWALPDDSPDTLLADIEAALTAGSVLRLDVLDGNGSRIALFLNGKTAGTVTVDLEEGGKPSEISG